MAFENISKGEITTGAWHVYDDNDLIIVDCSGDNTYANAEFIAFCFNLQQRYDISKLEEAVKLFERLLEQNMCSISGDQAIEQLLKQIKK